MKTCELCKSLATIYCESDRASLCWSCDAKVHSANFLVARHSRTLLCHSCQSPTPWSASGEKLGRSTVSICERCTSGDDGEESGDDDDEEYDGDEEGEDEIDLEDNQVVPWSSTPPPPAPSSSGSEECSSADQNVSVKRKRENVSDLSSEDDLDCSSMQRNQRTWSSAMVESAEIQSLPSRSDATVQKLDKNGDRNMLSSESESVAVVGRSKTTRTVGLELNSSDPSL